MSLDVYLIGHSKFAKDHDAIFIREHGQTVEVSRAEWDTRHPGREPMTCRVDGEYEYVYEANITHNLGKMASEAGIYKHLWRPGEIGITKAAQLVEALEKGLAMLKAHPTFFKTFNPENGWGSYDVFVPWVENYLQACREHPDAEVRASR